MTNYPLRQAGRIRRIVHKPLRTCNSLHDCFICRLMIERGQRYYDGGYGYRAHRECAVKALTTK
jgi:hypothetical protein